MLAITSVEATCAASNRAFFGVLKMHRPSVRSVPLLWDGVAWRVCDSDLVDLLPSERRHTRRVGGHTAANHRCSCTPPGAPSTSFYREGAARKKCACCGVVQMNSTMLLLGRAGAR